MMAARPMVWLGAIAWLTCACATALSAQSAHRSLRNGDNEYLKDRYEKAEKDYRIAADLEFSNPKALYNLGNSLYQQGKWKDAAERFDKAAQFSANKTDLANALHNLGNALLQQHQYKDAVEAYENSLRYRPGDAQTKTNLQLARKKLQQEQQQQKQQQQQQQQNQDQQQNQQQQNQQDQQQQQNQQQQQQGEPKDPGEQQQPAQPGKMRKEDARRILETAVEPDDQKNAKKYRSARQSSRKKNTKQDW